MPFRLVLILFAFTITPALAQTKIPGKIELTTEERAGIATRVREVRLWCPFASDLYNEGQRFYCAAKPAEQVRSGDRSEEYAVAIDRTGKLTFRSLKR